MTDSDDDGEREDAVSTRRALQLVLRGLLDHEEFATDDGADDAELDDMIGQVSLEDEPVDVADDGDGIDDTPDESLPTSHEHEQFLKFAVERQTRLDEIRRSFGFHSTVRLDEVDVSEMPSTHSFMTDPKWERMYSETGRVHNAIRHAIDPEMSELPEMGRGNVYDVPTSIAAIRLPLWAHIAPKLRPSNTVSTVHTNCLPNQERFSTNHGSTTFNPCSFAAIKLKLETSTGLFFKSGSGVVAGARGQQASSIACVSYIKTLQQMDMLPFEPTYKLQNIVSNATCFPIDLDELARRYPVNTRYEVSRFPGLVFRFGHGKAWVFIIFPSGNVIGTGFSDWIDANLAWRWLFAYVLVEFKDSKEMVRETAAEKKNRVYNVDGRFDSVMRAVVEIGYARAAGAMIRQMSTNRVDLHAAWQEITRLNRERPAR